MWNDELTAAEREALAKTYGQPCPRSSQTRRGVLHRLLEPIDEVTGHCQPSGPTSSRPGSAAGRARGDDIPPDSSAISEPGPTPPARGRRTPVGSGERRAGTSPATRGRLNDRSVIVTPPGTWPRPRGDDTG
jgi:hypothetical protein